MPALVVAAVVALRGVVPKTGFPPFVAAPWVRVVGTAPLAARPVFIHPVPFAGTVQLLLALQLRHHVGIRGHVDREALGAVELAECGLLEARKLEKTPFDIEKQLNVRKPTKLNNVFL